MDWMLDPPEDTEEWEEHSFDDVDPEDFDLYMFEQAAADASSRWQNERNF